MRDSFQNTDQKSDRTYWCRHFNEQAKIFSEPAQVLDFRNHNLMRQIHMIIVELINLESGRILDCGCGLGDLEVNLNTTRGSMEGLEIYCIDIAERILLKCKERLKNALPKAIIHFFLMDITNLGFRDMTFDLCIASEALQYVDLYLGLKEMFRVTKKGGQIILSVPNKLHPAIRRAEMRNKGKYRGIDLMEFWKFCKNRCRDVYVRPLIFARVQRGKPYIDNTLKRINKLSEEEILSANRFIIKMVA